MLNQCPEKNGRRFAEIDVCCAIGDHPQLGARAPRCLEVSVVENQNRTKGVGKGLETGLDAGECLMMKKQSVHFMLSRLLAMWMVFLPVEIAHGQSEVRSQDYLRDLIVLSKVLGQAHAIETRCRGDNSQAWREHMQGLLDLEAPYQTGLRRSMVNNFNIGYQISQAAHPVCSTAAATDLDALSETGRALANSLTRATLDEARLP